MTEVNINSVISEYEKKMHDMLQQLPKTSAWDEAMRSTSAFLSAHAIAKGREMRKKLTPKVKDLKSMNAERLKSRVGAMVQNSEIKKATKIPQQMDRKLLAKKSSDIRKRVLSTRPEDWDDEEDMEDEEDEAHQSEQDDVAVASAEKGVKETSFATKAVPQEDEAETSFSTKPADNPQVEEAETSFSTRPSGDSPAEEAETSFSTKPEPILPEGNLEDQKASRAFSALGSTVDTPEERDPSVAISASKFSEAMERASSVRSNALPDAVTEDQEIYDNTF